ncbi:MAG: 8-oxoguanine DNA glycosylase [Lachnospiraceae bacterium]|nr:8-oxoguanine DNA glycosylase [Lachnospiraceae bacterium]
MVISIDNMDLRQIADSGQCFRWNMKEEGLCEIIAYNRKLRIRQQGNNFDLDCDRGEWEEIWSSYLDTDTDYRGIGRKIEESGDDYLKSAYRYGSGIRILRQELWETLISFIISQNNNIKRIRGSIEAICSKAALPLRDGSKDGYRFPGPTDVDREFFNDKELGLGYRDGYLADMFEYAAAHSGFEESLKQMENEEAFLKLLSFKGIGRKVANCVCLFGLHHIDAFPIDTHIKQILEKYYPHGFDLERYKGYAGIVQQYMFYYKIKNS